MDSIMHNNVLKFQGNLQSLDNSKMHKNISLNRSTADKKQKKTTPPNNNGHDEIDNGNSANVDYRLESSRRESFKNWPSTSVDPVKLASAGFYFTGEGNVVKCFECDVKISHWIEKDNPMTDHQRWRSSCRFVRKMPCGNVPFGINSNNIPATLPRGQDICGPYGDDNQPLVSTDFKTKPMELSSSSIKKDESMGLNMSTNPKHPKYISKDARLQTFQSWPISLVQTKEELAEAGFYYTGRGDQTICFDCGIGLMHWEPEDNPWEQHVIAREKCRFACVVKGREYITSVLEKKHSSEVQKATVDSVSSDCSQEADQTTSEGKKEESMDAIPSTSKASSSMIYSLPNNIPDNPRLCKICCKEERAIVFLPCGHIIACPKCAPGMTICAFCQEFVAATVHAIIS